ncbi:MAG: hypothetical protein QXU75_05400 [Candidatus Methanomethylicaceae archaeon]
MPFKYIIKWHRGQPEKLSVEAYHKYPHTEEEKHKPAFVIGRTEGAAVLAIRHMLEKASQKFPIRKYKKTIHIILNENNEEAYENAYRIGLAAALLSKAKTPEQIQKSVRYVQNVTPEEIWFWTSKILDEEVGERAIEALFIICGCGKIDEKISKTKNESNLISRQKLRQKQRFCKSEGS